VGESREAFRHIRSTGIMTDILSAYKPMLHLCLKNDSCNTDLKSRKMAGLEMITETHPNNITFGNVI